MMTFVRKHLPEILLTLFIVAYSVYFSLLTINRYEKLYAHYFDLGIMHQSVYNTYQSIKTADFSRFLEMTNPHTSAAQIKRMSIHNDMLLALLAPFYFIHEGPETILVIQTIVVAIGALYVFLIAKKVLKDLPYSEWLALVLAVSYLLYSPLQKANKFEFHAVTLATTFLLAAFYYWREKQYKASLVSVGLSLITKEQVGMTTALFGGYILVEQFKHIKLTKLISHFTDKLKTDKNVRFALITIAVSIFWILLSMFVIIPMARGDEHFASKYYDHIKERPWRVFTYPFKESNIAYFLSLFGPTGFLALFSPLIMAITIPEFGINLLSNNSNMRNTYFHYDSLITPFIFIATIYSVKTIYEFFTKRKVKKNTAALVLGGYILLFTFIFSYLESPLPYSKQKDLYPWYPPEEKYYGVIAWKEYLQDDQIKVSSTGKLAPHFTSRQYFYDFSWKYTNAEYVIIEEHDVLYGFLQKQSKPAYSQLQNDKNYIKIYDENGIEVFKKI